MTGWALAFALAAVVWGVVSAVAAAVYYATGWAVAFWVAAAFFVVADIALVCAGLLALVYKHFEG